jgi:hypothetical protein
MLREKDYFIPKQKAMGKGLPMCHEDCTTGEIATVIPKNSPSFLEMITT